MATDTIVCDLTTPFVKAIQPVWEQNGKRRRIVGFQALLNDGLLTIAGSTYPATFNSYIDAENALDEAALLLIEETALSADLEADACLPFEPTQAELAAYAQEWDTSAEAERTALEVYAAEWDAEADYLEDEYSGPIMEYGSAELDALIRRLLMPDSITIRHTPYETEYRCGNAAITVEPDENAETLRDMQRIFTHPDLQALMGVPAVTVTDGIEENVDGAGTPWHWLEYRAGNFCIGIDPGVGMYDASSGESITAQDLAEMKAVIAYLEAHDLVPA